MPRVLPLLLSALLLAPLAAPPALAQASRDGVTVLPQRDGSTPMVPVEFRWRATPGGIGFLAAPDADPRAARTFFRAAGSSRVVEVDDPGDVDVLAATGTVVVAPRSHDVDRGRDLRLLDPATGAQTGTVRVNGTVRAVGPAGVLSVLSPFDAPGELRLTTFAGEVRTLLTFPQRTLDDVAADERGFVAALRVEGGTAVDVVAVDLDGTSRSLARYGRDDAIGFPVFSVAVSPTYTAYRSIDSDRTVALTVVRRDGTGTAQVRRAPDVQGLALRDDAVAWFGSAGAGFGLHTAPLDPAQPATSLSPQHFQSSSQLQSGPDGFVVVQTQDAPSPGFGLVRPGGTSIEPWLAGPPVPAELYDLQLDASRVTVDDEVLDGDLAVRDVDRGAVGPERVLPAGRLVLLQQLSGDRLLTLEATSAGADLVVREAGRELRRTAVGEDLASVRLSGRRLLVTTGGGTTGKAVVHDLASGATLTLPPSADLWGPYVVYVDPQGTVVRRDLDRPSSPLVVVRRQVPAAALLQVDGDDVLVDPGHRNGLRAVSLHRVRGTAVTTRALTGVGPDTGLLLSGGVVAQHDATQLQLADAGRLADGWGSTLYGVGDLVPPALDDDTVAWAGTDGRVRVRALPVEVSRAARLLSTTAAAGTTGAWTFGAEASEALRSWRLELRGASGSVVAVRAGTGRSSSVRASWDGRLPSGAAAPDGVYRWTLSGVDLDGDGALAGPDGGAVPSGTVAVRRAAPALTALTAPVVSTVESAGRSFPVRWSAPAGLPVDLRYAEVVGGVAGPSKPWLTGTTARSAVFGVTGTPRVVDGRTYRITAVARDELGRTSAARAVTTVVPVDDRSTAVRYGGTWSPVAASGRYAGTLRVSRARGATATLTGSGRSLRVVADRCPTCGRVAVVLDGRTVATVDLRASTTRARQVVWSRSFPRTGRHVLQLRVVSGRVALDGVAVGQ